MPTKKILLIDDESNLREVMQLRYQVAGAIAKPFDPIKLPAQLAELLGWDFTSAINRSDRLLL